MHKGYKSMILNKNRPFDAERVKFPVLERLDHDKSHRSVSVRYSLFIYLLIKEDCCGLGTNERMGGNSKTQIKKIRATQV